MSRKEQIIEMLRNENAPEEVINDFLKAKSWSTMDKERFTAWVSEKIGYLSSQPIQYEETKKSLNLAKLQYELYLIIVNE